ncbi:MAG: tetratricopeptide repeat protein [Bradymonadia bacterium]
MRRSLSSLFITGALLGSAWLSTAQAAPPPDTTRVAPLLDQGRYAEAAKVYADLYEAKGSNDTLFNAAFYYGRARQPEKAMPFAKAYLEKVACQSPAQLTPRQVRHCALSAEMLGHLEQALALFEGYQKRAKVWAHRSRAEDDIHRVQLKMKVKALEAELAALKGK